MITAEEKSTSIITNITAAPIRYKIKAGPRAFKVLSGFYSEPLLAIPRELGANAWDSHVAAGNTKRMFEVHAPNQLEPWFSVRDFGTGMSPENIEHIYTTYFESTKTNDNDSDGCMGLGSKTPLNYDGNFNVTSWYGGKRYVYNCYLDETKSPCLVPVSVEDSNEPTGMEIKMAIKIADISSWIGYITRAYTPFRFRPIIKGATINYPERKYVYQGTGWAHRESVGYSSNGCNAFMGNYCYPVSLGAIENALRDDARYSDLRRAFNYGRFDLFFNIGDLEVAPNKEQLQYEDNNSTTTKIIAALNVALDELKAQVMDKLEVPKTRWDAMKLHHSYNSYSGGYNDVRNLIGDIPIMFNGTLVQASSVGMDGLNKHMGLQVSPDQFQVYVVETVTGKMRKTSTYNVNQNRPVAIFYTNGATIKNARFRHHLVSKYGVGAVPYCYIITDSSPGAQIFRAHKNYFGWDAAGLTVTEVESLPKPPTRPRAARTATTDEIFYTSVKRSILSTRRKEISVNWSRKAAAFDSTKTYYYMDFLWYDPACDGVNVTREFVDDVVKVFSEAKLGAEDEIYGINRKNRHLLKVGTWINVSASVAKWVAANKATLEHDYYLHSTYAESLSKLECLYNLTKFGGFLDKLTNPTTKTLFTAVHDACSKYADSTDAPYSDDFYKKYNIVAKKHQSPPVNADTVKTLLDKKYMGVFGVVNNSDYYNKPHETVAKIVNFIDENS